MKVSYSLVSQPSFELNRYKNDSNIENSPTGSDYSLPCLSSDDVPHPGYGLGEAAPLTDIGILEPPRTDTDVAKTHLVQDFDSLPPSDIPSPASPITAESSQEDIPAIRPFPLLDLMHSPAFAAIRSLNDAPGRCCDYQWVKLRLT